MNKSYRTMWNAALGAWVAVSELVAARGKRKKSAMARALAVGRCSLKNVTLVVVVASALIGGLPKKAEAQYTAGGGTVTGGATGQGHGIAIGGNSGGDAVAATPTAIAIGTGGTVAGAVGSQGGGEVAIGQSATATGQYGTAIGSNAGATGQYSSAFGNNSTASGDRSSVVGFGAAATGSSSTALGQGAKATDNYATALGQGATAAVSNATALGQGATASLANSVAVGSNSITDKTATAVPSVTISGIDYTGFSGTASGVFSVGAPSKERQIINVAPGAISSSSTDAVNGSQLYATDTVIASLSTSASTGISTAQSGVNSLSTGLSTTNSNVSSLST
ncbi:ESPR-type extended signal peptide-containing protein, partial [Burkholderia ubonensis]